MPRTLTWCLIGVVVHTCITLLVATQELPRWILQLVAGTNALEWAALIGWYLDSEDTGGEPENNDAVDASFDSGIGLESDFEDLDE